MNVSNEKPAFIITIDTEGDNLWSKPKTITTRNAECLERFQILCEKFHYKPTFLVNYEMACSSVFQEFGKTIIKNDMGEIGMHLHAWNTPPTYDLTENDYDFQPPLIHYPRRVIREKIRIMTDLLQQTFQVKIQSHRAGQWYFNEFYAKVLMEMGYKVDCSVTPHVFWKNGIIQPYEVSNDNAMTTPSHAYFLDSHDIRMPGESDLLEVPVTIIPVELSQAKLGLYKLTSHFTPLYRLVKYFLPKPLWLRPNGRNLNQLLMVVQATMQEKRDYIEFVLHSSELMPGANPYFPTRKKIDDLYYDLELLFAAISENHEGCTLNEYYLRYCQNRRTKP